MRWRREPPPETPDLSNDTCAVLLHGWSHADPPEPKVFTGFSGNFLTLFDPDDRGFVALWQVHEKFLRWKARQWNWRPAWGPKGDLFYAEAIARGEPTDVDVE